MSRSPETAFFRPLERLLADRRIRTQAVGQTVEAGQFAASSKGHQCYFLPGARLEPHRGAGRNIEPHAEGRGAVELHRLVDLEEMEMRPDLDRPVAGVSGLHFDRRATGVEVDAAVDSGDAPGMLGIGLCAGRRTDRLMDGHEL